MIEKQRGLLPGSDHLRQPGVNATVMGHNQRSRGPCRMGLSHMAGEMGEISFTQCMWDVRCMFALNIKQAAESVMCRRHYTAGEMGW